MLIAALINVIVAAVILGLVYWLLTLLPLPEPFHRVILVAFVLILLLYLLGLMTGFPAPAFYRPMR